MRMKWLLRFLPLTFKRKLIAYSVLLSTVPILLHGLISATITARSIQQVVDVKNQVIVDQIKSQLSFFMKQLSSTSVSIASDSRVINAAKAGSGDGAIDSKLEMISALSKYQNFSPINFSVSIIYPQSDYVYSTYGTSSYSNSVYRKLIQKNGSERTFPFYATPDRMMGQNELLLFLPVPLNSSFATDCVLVLHVSIVEMTRVLGVHDGGIGRRFYLVNELGRVIISQNSAEIGYSLFSPEKLQGYWNDRLGYWGSTTVDDVPYKLFATKADTVDWTFIDMTRYSELTGESDLIRRWTLGIAGLMLLVSGLFSIITSQRLYIPIERLVGKFRGDSKKNDHDKTDDLQKLDSTVSQIVNDNSLLQSRLNEYLPMVQESLIRQLLRGELNALDISHRMQEIYKISLLSEHNYFAVVGVQIDRPSDYMLKYSAKDRSLIQYALCKLIIELFEPVTPCLTIMLDPMRVTVVIGWKSSQNGAADVQMLQVGDEFRELVRKYFHFTTSVSISQIRAGLVGIHTSYQKALDLLSHRILLGENVTISESSVVPPNLQPNKVIFQHQKAILEAVMDYDQKTALECVDALVKAVQHVALYSPPAVFGVFSHFIGRLDELTNEAGLSLHGYFDYNMYEYMQSLDTLDDIQQWMMEKVIPGVIDSLHDAQTVDGNQLMKQAILYVQMHYDRDISLQQLAEMYRLTPSKLSRMFKLKTGVGFGEYLTAYRMEKAMEWLRSDVLSIGKISERLRYTAVQSFNRAFRQAAGMAPSEYRKQYQQQNDSVKH